MSRTCSPIHTEDFRSNAGPPTVKDRFSNSYRKLSFQRCSTNCQRQVLQFTPKTFAPALHHQLSRTSSPIHTEDFRSSAAPPTVKDKFPNSHRRLPLQRCSTNCQGRDLQFTPKTFVPALLHQLSRTVLQFTPKTFAPPLRAKTFVPALLHQLSRTGFPIHTEDFRSSATPPTVKGKFSNSHRRLSFKRCSTNCHRQDLQFTPKTFVQALLHQLSKTGSPIHTEDFRSSAAPPTVKDRFSNSHRRLSLEGCSTNCQGQVLQFTPKTFAPALLHQLSRTGFPIHTEDFRSSATPPTVKGKFSNSHRRLSFKRCSTNCQGRDLQFTPKTFVPALLHQLSRAGSPIHTEDSRSSAAPPTVKDGFSNSHRRLSFQRCSTNCQGRNLQFTRKDFRSNAAPPTVKDGIPNSHRRPFVPALPHQLSRTGSPIHTENFRSSAAPPTVKDGISNSHRKLSSQRCSTNCQRQVLTFTPKTIAPARVHQLSKTGSPIHTKDFRSSAAPPNCQGQVLQFTPKTFVPALLHQLSRTGSPIHTKDFRSSAAPPIVKDMFPNPHRGLSLQRCATNCQGQVFQFTPKTFAPALLYQLSRTGFPIHTEDFRSSAAPPPVKDNVLQLTPKSSAPALLHHLSRTGSPTHTEVFRSSAAPPTAKDKFSNSHRKPSLQRCSTNCQRQVLQYSPKTFVPALLHQLSRTGSLIHTEDFRSSATPPTVKDKFSNLHRKP